MKLVIGGAFQGKLEFAQKTYQISDGWIDGRICDPEEITQCRGIHHFHEYIRRMPEMTQKSSAEREKNQNTVEGSLSEAERNQNQKKERKSASEIESGQSPEIAGAGFINTDNPSIIEQQAEAFADWLYKKNPNLVIVSNELGYGVVPMEKKDRLWRERVGRVCTCIAARADEVVRVVCGIGTRLK